MSGIIDSLGISLLPNASMNKYNETGKPVISGELSFAIQYRSKSKSSSNLMFIVFISVILNYTNSQFLFTSNSCYESTEFAS